MQCITCSTEIPSAWVAAIARNVCPGCDGPIMLEEAKTLMTEISEAFERMPHDPQGLAGWLMDNYRLQKVGTGEPTGFHRKPNGPAVGHVQDGTTHQDNGFIQRAGANKMIETSNLLAQYQSAFNGPQPQEDVRTPEEIIDQENADMVRKATLVAQLQGREVTSEDLVAAANSAPTAPQIHSRQQLQVPATQEAALVQSVLGDHFSTIPDIEEIYANSSQLGVQKSRLAKLAGTKGGDTQKKLSRI